MVDTERFRNKYDLYRGGVFVKGALGIKVLETESIKAQLGGTADLQLMVGTFREPKTAIDEVTHDFNTLISKKKYRTHLAIAPYFSRARLLNQEQGNDNEVKDIGQVRHDFNLKKAGIDQRLSLYMLALSAGPQPPATQKPLVESSAKPTWASAPVRVASGEITEAKVIGVVGKGVIGAEVKIDLLDLASEEVEKVGLSAGLNANLSASGSLELMARNRSEVKRTLTGQRFVDATKSDQEKESIKQQVETQFNSIEKALFKTEANVKHRYLTELGFDVLTWAKETQTPERDSYLSEELYRDARRKNNEDVIQFSAFLEKNNLDSKLVKLRHKSHTDQRHFLSESGNSRLTSHNRTSHFTTTTKKELKQHINFLKQDLKKYTALHKGKVGSGQEFRTQAQKQKAISEFEGRYGATSPEELVHRMHIASLYLLTNIDIEKPENEQVVDKLLQLEKRLASPLFIIDKNYLNDRLYFLEDLSITLYQAKFDIELKAGMNAFLKIGEPAEPAEPDQASPANPTAGSDKKDNDTGLRLSASAGVNSKFKCGVTYNYLSGHRNILRKGHSLQFSVTAGVGINVEATIKAVAPDFNKHLPSDIAQSALDELKGKLLSEIALAKSWAGEVTFDFYLSKPDKLSENGKGFALSHLFSRESATTTTDSTYKKTIGLSTYTLGAIPFDVFYGGGRVDVKTEPLVEMVKPATILHSSIQYNHAYDVGEIDKITGKIDEDCYTHEVEKQLNAFFICLANEPDGGNDEQPKGAITLELDEFETAVNDNTNYLKQLLVNFQNARRASTDADKIDFLRKRIDAVRQAIKEGKTSNELDGVLKAYNFKRARDKLKKAATLFRDHQARKDVDTAVKREKAVRRFRKLMQAFNPHYLEKKSNSADLKPLPLAPLNMPVTI